jgi:hypothetical protein
MGSSSEKGPCTTPNVSMELARGGLLGRIEGGVELFDCDSDDNMKECWVPFKIINNGRSNDGQQMSPKISIMRVGTDWFTTLKPEYDKQTGWQCQQRNTNYSE